MELLEETQEKRVLLLEWRRKNEKKKREDKRYRERRDRSAEEIKESEDVGENRIENETWRFMSKESGEEFWKQINKVLKGEGIPADWNKALYTKRKRERLKITEKSHW